MTNLPNELLEYIYDKIPNVRDRVALASTSRQMRRAQNYSSIPHFIRKESDIDLAIAHRATHVTFYFPSGNFIKNPPKNPNMYPIMKRMSGHNLLDELHRMKDVKYLKFSNIGLANSSGFPALPPNLVELDCSNNYGAFTTLPPLPSTLVVLKCSFNGLTELPTLPENLKLLDCRYNALTRLPKLPPTLVSLDCSGNKIIQLPKLPPTLKHLKK